LWTIRERDDAPTSVISHANCHCPSHVDTPRHLPHAYAGTLSLVAACPWTASSARSASDAITMRSSRAATTARSAADAPPAPARPLSECGPTVEFLELPSDRRTANLPGMDVDFPSRVAARPRKVLSPDSRRLSHSREKSAADVGDCRPPSHDDAAAASKVRGTDREERLLRYVDILRTEQVLGSIEANEQEGGKTGFRRSRGLVLALAVIAVAVAAALLLAEGARRLHSDVQPNSEVGITSAHSGSERDHVTQRDLPLQTAPAQPPDVLSSPVPQALPPDNPHTTVPTITQQQVADPPDMTEVTRQPAAVPSQPQPSNELTLQHREGGAADEVSESQTAKPVLRVYYPSGSLHAETNARSLLARVQPDLTRSDAEAQTGLPNEAVIKFSEERNHPLARLIGKSLGILGYRWKIENASGMVDRPRNVIEVWLPS
jgi:hypothetical protein